jgi:outer membrane biosynthesis protein TonB
MIEHLLQAERALANGLLDQAETLYRSAADADPRNAIAVVGLARVAVERGDEAHALELGLRALVIDPENSAAQRLVARIREVRAYRGEAVEGWTPDEVLAAAPTLGGPPAVEPSRADPTPMPEPAPTPEPTPEPTPQPAQPPGTPEPTQAREPTSEPEPTRKAWPPHQPRRPRSLLDRLLRRRPRR